jgi:hypothetical protein
VEYRPAITVVGARTALFAAHHEPRHALIVRLARIGLKRVHGLDRAFGHGKEQGPGCVAGLEVAIEGECD